MRARHILTALIVLAIVTGTWWWLKRGPEVAAIAPTRGTAAEIVYATGAVQPVRWAKVTSLIRQRIIEICDCEGHQVKRGDVLARAGRPAEAVAAFREAAGLTRNEGERSLLLRRAEELV